MSANQMSDNAQGLVDESATRQRASERGLKAVEESQDSARIVREQVESVARVTVTLNEKAAKVERIVFFVNELTERSNILSINAALLAATSEKGGESFAVLADEMQKLTSRSKESTLEIHDMLQSIRAEIQRVVLAAEEATKQVETGEKFAGQASKSIKSLKQAVDEGNNHFLQVVAAVRQQNQALSQVEQALVAMRDSAQLVEEGGRKIENSSTDLAKLSNKLGDTALLKAVRES